MVRLARPVATANATVLGAGEAGLTISPFAQSVATALTAIGPAILAGLAGRDITDTIGAVLAETAVFRTYLARLAMLLNALVIAAAGSTIFGTVAAVLLHTCFGPLAFAVAAAVPAVVCTTLAVFLVVRLTVAVAAAVPAVLRAPGAVLPDQERTQSVAAGIAVNGAGLEGLRVVTESIAAEWPALTCKGRLRRTRATVLFAGCLVLRI